MKRLGFWTIVLLLASASCAGEMSGLSGRRLSNAEGYEFHEMSLERLPDLNIARAGHMLRYIGGELTVFGGHTTGFIPTGTAEYYKKGKWQLMGMVYPHDYGAVCTMPSGELMLCCGCEKPLGVGHSSYVESYDPSTHKFRPLPELDWQGVKSSAVPLADGTFVVSGNWWHEDGIVSWSPERGVIGLAPSFVPRADPYILPVAPDNAIIFGAYDNYGQRCAPIVDQLRGEAFEEPLLQEWLPVYSELNGTLMDQFTVGDPTKGAYVSLLTGIREDGQAAILKVDGTVFSLLDLERPLPKKGLGGEFIIWISPLIDKAAACAWLLGLGEDGRRFYAARVSYEEALQGGRAAVRLHYLGDADVVWTLTSYACLPGGRIACVGGGRDNYEPSAQAIILHTEPRRRASIVWLVSVLGLLLVAAAIAFLRISRTHKKEKAGSVPEETVPAAGPDDRLVRLMEQIKAQMEEKELFRKNGLTKEDLARAVSSNSRYVSDCINALAGCSFIDYVNGYRIRYAQRLLYENPELRLSEISEESGFSSEVTFYRNFKARTGLTPGEWLTSQKTP